MYESAGVRGAALTRSGDKTQTSKRVTMGCHGVQLVRLIVSLSFSLGEKHMFLNGDIGLACSTNKSFGVRYFKMDENPQVFQQQIEMDAAWQSQAKISLV